MAECDLANKLTKILKSNEKCETYLKKDVKNCNNVLYQDGDNWHFCRNPNKGNNCREKAGILKKKRGICKNSENKNKELKELEELEEQSKQQSIQTTASKQRQSIQNSIDKLNDAKDPVSIFGKETPRIAALNQSAEEEYPAAI